jgi:hypothetical protein
MMHEDIKSQKKADGIGICIILRVCIPAVVQTLWSLILYSTVMGFDF